MRSAMVRNHQAPKTVDGYIPLICPDCRLQQRITELLKPYGLTARFGGDPRGAVLVVSGPTITPNDWERKGLVIA